MIILIGNNDKVNRSKFYGDSGISGAVSFYCPQLDIYLTGPIDNVGRSELCIQLVYLLLSEIEKEIKMKE